MIISVFIGIDPGIKGAIAFLKEGEAVVFDMPLLPNKEIDPVGLSELFIDNAVVGSFCIIEKAQAMPKQGVVSTFNYGKGYGAIIAVLSLLRVTFQEVSPKKWKNTYGLTSDKKQSVAVAGMLFPDIPLITKRGRLLDGRAEALLLADYARTRGVNWE